MILVTLVFAFAAIACPTLAVLAMRDLGIGSGS